MTKNWTNRNKCKTYQIPYEFKQKHSENVMINIMLKDVLMYANSRNIDRWID